MSVKITNVKIYDGFGNSSENSCIVFDSAILAVGKAAEAMEADTVIDGTGKVLMPGLIDSHCHLTVDAGKDFGNQNGGDSAAVGAVKAVNNCRRFLRHGVTSTRSLGSNYDVDIDIRELINEGVIEGPNLVCSGMPLTMTGGHGWAFSHEVDGVDAVTKYTRLQIKHGADVIKMFASGGGMTKGVKPGSPYMTEEEMHAACFEATKVGKTSSAHSQSVEGNKNAIRAGVTSIEHGVGLDDEAIELMKEHGTYLVPTLSAPYNTVKYGPAAGVPDWAVQKNIEAQEPLKQAFQLAHKNGIKIAMGTDAGTPFNFHGSVAIELELMHEYGMTVDEVIVAATSTAAELLQILDKTGSVTEGKLADLLMLNTDPAEDIHAFEDIFMVFKSGKKINLEN